MIIESILITAFALSLDFTIGDPKNRYHPTAWVGRLIAKLIPLVKTGNPNSEKLGGIAVVLITVGTVCSLLLALDFGINLLSTNLLSLVISVAVGAILLKTTIAVSGMQQHALEVVDAIERNDLESAKNNLSMIVKRKTKNLDKNHILSGVLESVSENTVDGVTGPLFYYALFGLPGAFAYRVVNTIDSMIGYKTEMFKNLGWFGANCDKILNFIPARLTGLVMILGAALLGYNWKSSYNIMIRDGRKLESPNAGYPMAALAGAIETKLVKVDHYSIGDGNFEITKQHILSAITLMKVSSILFCGMITIPLIVILTYLGWWIHA